MTPSNGPRRKPRTVEPNVIRIEQSPAEEIVPQLDEHLAALFTPFHQYRKHRWLAEKPQARELHGLLQAFSAEALADADRIAERLTALGGVPSSAPARQAEVSYIEHEPEGAFRVREMLERDREAEANVAERLRSSIHHCCERNDYGSETLLRAILLRAEDRAHQLDRLLGHDALDPKRPSEG